MSTTRFIQTAVCAGLLAWTGCETQEQAAPAEPEIAEAEKVAEAEESAEPEEDVEPEQRAEQAPAAPSADNLPIAEDFAAEAEQEVTEDNYVKQLAAMEEELAE